MINMETKKKEERNLFLEFLLITFLPWYIIGEKINKKSKSVLLAGIIALLSFIITFCSWCLFWTTDNHNTNNTVKEVIELKDQLTEKDNEINQLKKKLLSVDKSKNEETKVIEKKTNTPKLKKSIEEKPKTYVFSNGNYISGKDFEEGIYNIEIVSGEIGNVMSSNLLDGGINAVMGTNKEYADQEYKNIELSKNIKLTVKSVKIKLIKVE